MASVYKQTTHPHLKKLKNKVWAQILIIYTRYLIGATFLFASLIKIKGRRFTTQSGADYPIDSAWHLFETLYQSGLYWQFIGIGQLFAGFMLMTQRYAKLGALLFLPIIGNIFVITLSYYFAYTPVITGMMLAANLLLVAWDWDELKILIGKKPAFDDSFRLEDHKIWEWIGLVIFAFTFTYRLLIDQYDIAFWASICFLIGASGLVIGIKSYSKKDI